MQTPSRFPGKAGSNGGQSRRYSLFRRVLHFGAIVRLGLSLESGTTNRGGCVLSRVGPLSWEALVALGQTRRGTSHKRLGGAPAIAACAYELARQT